MLTSLAFAFSLLAQDPTATPAPATPPVGKGAAHAPIYDEAADAKQQVADAVARVAPDDRRVLIVWGANWCGSCRELENLMRGGTEGSAATKRLQKTLANEFEVVHLDVGRFDKNIDLVRKWRADVSGGIPALTVLDGAGKVRANQDNAATSALIEGGDVAKLADYLDGLKGAPKDAAKTLDDALARAKDAKKNVFVHFGAPWCVSCRKLDAWCADPKVAPLVAKDFVEVKIDVDRMTGGTEVMKRYRKADDTGIPWFAVLGPDGALLATSDAKDGTIGMPAKPDEIEFVIDLLQKQGPHLTEADFAELRAAFVAHAG